jgi:hypothetical protein
VGRWRFAIVVSLLVVILVSSCNSQGDNQPSPPPQLPSIPGAVTLTPDQVILPDEQFPLAGYSVATDNAVGTNSWTRMWAGTGAYWWVRVDVTVLGPSASSSDAIAKTVCDWTFTPPMLGAAEVAAPVVGDGAKACGYDSATAAASTMVYTTGTRNVLVTVGANRRTTTSTSAAANFISSLADYQLWIIDKVAPLPGVALRPTPQVQVPAVAVVVTPQPTRTAPSAGPTPAITLTPSAEMSIKITSVSCVLVYYGTSCDVHVSGTVSGPVLALEGGPSYDRLTCGVWHFGLEGAECQRGSADPVATTWSYHDTISQDTTSSVSVRDGDHYPSFTQSATVYYRCTMRGTCSVVAGP